MKCLVVGAGPTGLTVALEFARQGVHVDIVDAKDKPSELSRAVGILPNSIRILNKSGAGERIVKESVKYEQIFIHRDNVTLLSLKIPTLPNKADFMLGLPQNRTEQLMSERLKEMGVDVRYGTKVTQVSSSETSATVTFENGKSVTYDWVIGADGVRSTVRESMGIAFNGYELDEDWSIADVELANGYEPVIRAWMLQGEHKERDALIMIPIAEGRVRLISSTPDSLAAIPLSLDVRTVRRSGTFKISVRQAEHYVMQRVILAGDAAHAHSPVGGRGMNLGIADAAAAVEAILENTTTQYGITRRKTAGTVIRSTEAIRKILVSNNPFALFVLRLVTWFIQNTPFIQKKFFNFAVRL